MNFSEQAAQLFQTRVQQAKSGPERSFRERAWSEFERQGLPDRRNEFWKYSSLSELTRVPWSAASGQETIPSQASSLLREWKAEMDIALLLNGQWKPKSSLLTLESGYEFGSVHVGTDLQFDDGFVSLAAAVHRGGYRLNVAPQVRLVKPILLIHAQSEQEAWSSTLNSIELGSGAEVDVIEIFVGEESNQRYLRTDLARVRLQEGARLNWLRLQQESGGAYHVSEAQVSLAANARLNLAQINSGAHWSRASLKARIEGEGAEVSVNGLSFGRDSQHTDQRVQIRHDKGFSQSSQLFKGVLRDQARGVLNGKIHIAEGSQKVVSSQLNHNLLLSPGAEADTKPELEIYADDVKANHGATVGRLDDKKLFYLMSRAISRAEAERMLAEAFVSDVIMKIEKPALREFLERRVRDLLPKFIAGAS